MLFIVLMFVNKMEYKGLASAVTGSQYVLIKLHGVVGLQNFCSHKETQSGSTTI